MTNQSREAFEKWAGVELNGSEDRETNWMWSAWQAALSEGRRQGLEEAAEVAINVRRAYPGQPIHDACVDAIRALIAGGGEVV